MRQYSWVLRIFVIDERLWILERLPTYSALCEECLDSQPDDHGLALELTNPQRSRTWLDFNPTNRSLARLNDATNPNSPSIHITTTSADST